MTATACPICASSMAECFRATVLNRHEAIFDLCASCDYLRARRPHWLDEAYTDAISLTDTGLLQRNQAIARQLRALFAVLGDNPAARYLDFAGGYGVLTRLMRDSGFDFYWSDRYCRNLLAPGFEYRVEMGACRAVTAFEVLEHVEDPRAFVVEAMAAGQADMLVFTTALYAGAPPARDWWYYSFDTGQHISFFTHKTLARLADVLNLHFTSKRDMHILSRSPLSAARINVALGRLGYVIGEVARRQRTSKVWPDHLAMSQQLRNEAKRSPKIAHEPTPTPSI
jgi:hypothetical protein